jgi:hypothetical protein
MARDLYENVNKHYIIKTLDSVSMLNKFHRFITENSQWLCLVLEVIDSLQCF